MSSRDQENPKSKAARKKLRLSKETLKDLTDARGSVKGGGIYIPKTAVTCLAVSRCDICGPG